MLFLPVNFAEGAKRQPTGGTHPLKQAAGILAVNQGVQQLAVELIAAEVIERKGFFIRQFGFFQDETDPQPQLEEGADRVAVEA
ncbi:hypothetical protein D3C73_1293370 [compost metagenome]